ncbi:hypothetical protein [Bacillus sp. EB600]|uniref:hypothetical protein n=1 Tax=Bacillus sp. EB600 TaxID=2806345 RepID=UPI00210B4729|nr:hypothetical protein [Bacillus sp. EB600]MCQ6281695.1 hypothetical protein [Bacillus sp. EB600]
MRSSLKTKKGNSIDQATKELGMSADTIKKWIDTNDIRYSVDKEGNYLISP